MNSSAADTQQLYLGLMGGSYESCAICTNVDITHLKVVHDGPVCLHKYSHSSTSENLRRLCKKIAAAYGCTLAEFQEQLAGKCFSVAGINTEIDVHEAKCLLLGAGWKKAIVESFTVVDYSRGALAGANSGRPGIVVVSNVGSAVYVSLTPEPLSKVVGIKGGGWGPMIADFGSAFDIGVNLLRHLTSHFESGEIGDCPACKCMLGALEFENIEEVVVWFDLLWHSGIVMGWRQKIAELAFCVMQAYESEKNEQAKSLIAEIFMQSTRGLAECVERLVKVAIDRKQVPKGSIEIGLEGIVFGKSQTVATLLAEQIDKFQLGIDKIRIAQYRVPVGAWILSMLGYTDCLTHENPEHLFSSLGKQIAKLENDTKSLLIMPNAGQVLSP